MARSDVTPEEFEELFQHLAPEIHRYLRRRVDSDADDVLAEVFVVAWRRRRDLPEVSLRKAWLYGVARRLIRAKARSAARSSATFAAVTQQGHDGSTSDEERESTVRRALDSLTAVDRDLITLTVWEGLPVAEAAFSLGMRPGAARVRLHRARKRLAANPEMSALAGQVAPLSSASPEGARISSHGTE